MSLEIRLSENGKTVKQWDFGSVGEAVNAAWIEVREGREKREALEKRQNQASL